VSGATRTCGPVACFSLSATVTLSVNEPATTQVRVNGGAWQTYTGPFVVNTIGSNLVEFFSTDTAGNVEAIQSLTVKITDLIGGLLDDFNRADGRLGANWSGSTASSQYRIVGQRVDVGTGGPLYWNRDNFGADQEAFVTLSRIDRYGHHSILLKVQGGTPDWANGTIDIFYDGGRVGVETYVPGQGWRTLATWKRTLRDGDQLGGRALANGTVLVYINCELIGQANAGSFFVNKGGRIGLWFFSAGSALLDDFGGGNHP
jgi:hypothetical protein